MKRKKGSGKKIYDSNTNECISKESKKNQEKKQNGNKNFNSEYILKDGKAVQFVPKQEKNQNQQKKPISKKKTIYWDYDKKFKKYEGEMKDGKRDGKGISYDSHGNKMYEGEWKDGKWNGKGE